MYPHAAPSSRSESCYSTIIKVFLIKPRHHSTKNTNSKKRCFLLYVKCISSILLSLTVLPIPLSSHCNATHSFLCFCLLRHSIIMRFCVSCICTNVVMCYSLIISCLSYLIIAFSPGLLWLFIFFPPCCRYQNVNFLFLSLCP